MILIIINTTEARGSYPESVKEGRRKPEHVDTE